jgi:hypothetical protein
MEDGVDFFYSSSTGRGEQVQQDFEDSGSMYIAESTSASAFALTLFGFSTFGMTRRDIK